MRESPVFVQIQKEERQLHDTRKQLFERIEQLIERPLLSYFTSFRYPVMIEDTDADTLTDVINCMDLSKGLVVMLNSPGGDGLAAERIVNIFRSFSATNDFWVIIPGKAKSAATMISFGSSKIIMSPVSELGPVDPQITIDIHGTRRRLSVHSILQSYDQLFRGAEETEGNLEPYLQQLQNFDAREIEELKNARDLTSDISVRMLKSGMLSDKSEEKIRELIQIFLKPAKTKSHGRPIYRKEAEKAGLYIEKIDVTSELWHYINELYVRTNNFVSTLAAKAIESKDDSFHVSPPISD